jgi:hypothetical protein
MMLNSPAIRLEGLPGRSECRAVCVCGWETLSLTSAVAAQNADLHSLRCSRFRRWAHEQVDSLGETLGYYVPAQVVELLHILVDEPAAAAQIMPWLVGLEDRENA